MTDLVALQHAIDELETGLGDTPDLVAIRRQARRLRRRHRLVQGVGIAAAATTVLALGLGPAGHAVRSSFLGSPTQTASSSDGQYVVLTTPGWHASNVNADQSLIDLQFQNADGSQQLEVTSYPASEYDGYYADRQDIGDGQSIQVLGQSATMWAYSADDHTAIRTPAGGRFMELRASGMDQAAFEALLGQVVLTDQAGFAQDAPAGSVTPLNHDQAIRHLLQGVTLPPGFTAADVKLTGVNDPYQAAAQIAGQVGCAWIKVYDHGSQADRQAAVDAFESSRHWPLLLGIQHGGAYAQGFWQVADQLSGQVDGGSSVADLQQSLCS